MKITATTEGTEFNSAEWCEAMAAVLRAEGKLQFLSKGRNHEWISKQGFSFDSSYHYRKVIEQKMIRVTLMSGEVVEWPEPTREAPALGTKYFIVMRAEVVCVSWHNSPSDKRIIAAATGHLTREAAEQHLAALRKINAQGGV